MTSFESTIIVAVVVFLGFLGLQLKFFFETKKYSNRFKNFFNRESDYDTYQKEDGKELITQLKLVGAEDSDLNKLIVEINHYVAKTKGTTDFSVIQNKVERKLNMRYDQTVAKLAFPTYLGLMGTFLGVFIGISMFLRGFDGANNVTDESIKNLLLGVLVSMSTSLIGLLLTTINNARASESRKNIEEDKNEFYDFVQTELMPSLDVSMVLAITKLHETVGKFEPAFDRVISRFQDTFDKCTKAFGDSFEQNVTTVSNAVDVMGKNMDKINENISLQKQLLVTLKSDEIVKGLERYIEASNNFVSITKSLDKFEEARRMMLAATQEAINIQNTYSESLKVPREVAVRINQILDRIKDFEENINNLGTQLERREILSNDVVNAIQDQVKGISKKGKIADKYLDMADGKLEDLFKAQTEVIENMNKRYKQALEGHIDGFEEMLKRQTSELEELHKAFMTAINEKLNIGEIQTDFASLRKINEIAANIRNMSEDPVKLAALTSILTKIQEEISKIEIDEDRDSSNSGGFWGFGRR